MIPGALGLDPKKYPTLNQPSKEHLRIFNYTRSKNVEFAVIDLFNAFTSYLKGITSEMYNHNPIQIAGKAQDNGVLTFIEIVNLGSFENIQEEMVNRIFRKLEDERSTTKLLDKILSHTKIVIDENVKANALMYLEMRHLFIHNSGKADEKFTASYGTKIQIKSDGKLPTNFEVISEGINAVSALIEKIDLFLIKNSLVNRRK